MKSDDLFIQAISLGKYSVSEDGVVTSARTGAAMKSRMCGKYLYLSFCLDGVEFDLSVHRAVYQAFKGRTALEVDHVNGIRTDNRISNLRALTKSENFRAAVVSGKLAKKLKAADVVEIRARTLSISASARKFGVSTRTIEGIRAGKYWGSL